MMVCEGVQVEEVAHVNVLFTEAWFVRVTGAHLGCVVHLSTQHTMPVSTTGDTIDR